MAANTDDRQKLLFLLWIVLATALRTESAGYFISSPNVFHLGIPENVSVTVSGVTRPITVKLFLRDYPNRQSNFSHVQAVFISDEPGLLSIKVDPTVLQDSIPHSNQYVYLVAMCEDPQLVFLKETRVLISYRDKIVLVQIDKPIYTPRQTVKIRIMPLDFDLKPSNDTVDVVVKNPQRIRVQQWKKLRAENGFITKALYLGEHTMIGNWTIESQYGHTNAKNTTVKFEVKEYVLPRFSVRVVAPNYILPSAKSIKIALISRYTYGKAVQGNAIVRLSITGRGIPDTKFYSKTEKLADGKLTMKVDSGFIKKHPTRPWFPDGRRLRIECDVIEEATGMRESAVDDTVYFVSTPYHLNAYDTAKYFKSGLPFAVKVTVLYPNKEPAFNIPIDVSAVGWKADGQTKIDIVTKVSGKLMKTMREYTNSDGKVTFSLDIPRNVRSINVQIKTANRWIDAQENALMDVKVLSYQSKSGGYLHIRHRGGPKVKVGKTSSWDVFMTIMRNITQLHLMVLSRGRILVHRRIIATTGINVVSTLGFYVTPEMVPITRVLVYYFENNNEVVADSALLDVEEAFQNKVKLQVMTSSKVHLPGSTVDIHINARPGSTVALLGVDQSLYLLRKNNKLTRKKVFSKIRDLDLGCGVGPGRHSGEVFEHAGLVVMSSNDIVTKGRESHQCDESSKRRTKRSLQPKAQSYCCTIGRIRTRARCDFRARIVLGNATVQCRREFLRCCREETGEKETIVVRQRQSKERNAVLGDDADADSEQIRKYFPETWIFDEHMTGHDGNLLLHYTLPDTITTWVLQAVAISNTSGIGVTKVSRITTFKKFFVTLVLPFSVQRGEQISVKAIVFNYGQDETEFKVHLLGDRTYCSMSGPGQSSQPITFKIQGNDAKSVSFTIVPITLGKVPLQVVASGRMVSFHGDNWYKDIVQKELLVLPEGVERRLVHSLVLDPQGVLRDERTKNNTNSSAPHLTLNIVQGGKQINNVRLDVPKGSVPGSVSASLHLTGNLIGPAVTHLITGGLETLLRMPMGCGEQNMMYLAPNVYVLEYLTNTRQVTAEVETKAYRFLQLGYQQELGFRRKDKSFSAFGETRPGSTWLTAFVIKVFCAAQRFDGVTIDDQLICGSVTWLLQNQRLDGAFPEVQDMIHKSLLGGVHGTVAMTAFVLTALLECRCSAIKNQGSAIAKAVGFLEREVDSLQKPHILAITTYALALAHSRSGRKANTKLLHMSIYRKDKDQTTRHWSTGGHALDVETAGYALLAQLHLGHLKLGGPVVTWLTKQRNGQGGFVSTQDTCVALQALAKYSEKTAGAHMDLRVSIASDMDADWRIIYHVTKQNALTQRSIDVTSFLGGELFVDSSGTGVGQMQIEILHNVPSSRNDTCMFDLQVSMREIHKVKKQTDQGIFIVGRSLGREKREVRSRRRKKSKRRKCRRGKGKSKKCRRRNAKTLKRKPQQGKKKPKKKERKQKTQAKAPDALDIKVCTRYLKQGEAGMTILDIGIFTGFEPDKQSLIELQKNVRPTVDRFEFSDRSVVLYISKVPSDQEFCVRFQNNRVFGIGAVQPVPITIFDYYEPGDSCTRFYSPEERSELLLGICKGNQCKCTQDGCMPCSESFQNVDKMLEKACKKHDFVIQGEVVFVDEEQREEKSWLTYFVKVMTVIRRGRSHMRTGQILEYSKRTGCACPELREGEEYLMMGQKEMAQLVLDDKTTLLPWVTQRKTHNNMVNVFRERMERGYRCS